RLIKRIIAISILIIIISLIIVFKTNIFVIKEITCSGENLITKDYIIETMEQYKSNNIFTISKSEIEKKLKNNPYVKKVNITKKLPNKLNINVEEAKGLYYYFDGDYYCIVSNELIVLEKLDNIENRDLIEIKGFDVSISRNISDEIDNDTRVYKLLDEIYKEQGVIKENKEEFAITAVDVSNLSDIKIYINNIEVLVGNDENIRNKMSNAILIYKTGLPKEYINVGFNGTPDFK
ncbi:MAG: FtsQ-type POTRA domain-containing protein, partial [Clostridiales bacterium]|nr:FtsQ-type POTRA domain-containing protein [Clostridiales bacterium]